ncbi:MAG TPA: hypothetical protein VHE32_01305 [Rhodanobacteraceae bacterium]|nr:hypothetical protein [Rhodanobacteraceae bacterium]
MLVRLFFACALLASQIANAQSASNENATLSLTGDAIVRVVPGAEAALPLSVRVVDAHGAPLAGLVVEFFADACVPPPSRPDPCPRSGTYGRFADAAGARHALTDADGVATAPAFTAGALPGAYDVAACLFPQLHPEDAIVGTTLCVDLRVLQVAPLASSVPITPAFTGTWYDPAQGGHGLIVEVLPDSAFLAYWFAFDPEGAGQSWFGGVGSIADGVAVVSADIGSGGRWIPHFDPAAYSLNRWGVLIFQFSDCNHGRVDFSSVASMGTYGTGHMDITRLTQPAGLACP